MDAAVWELLLEIAPLNGYGYRITMQNLKSNPFHWPPRRLHHRCLARLTSTLLLFIAFLTSNHFVSTTQAQTALELSTASLTSYSEAEEEITWDVELNEPTCLNTEAVCTDKAKSICVIKNRWGCTEALSVRPEDEIWIVSARDCCAGRGKEALEVKRLSEGVWQTSSLEILGNCHQTNRALSTLVYVHGNQTDYQYGMSRGVQFYHNFVSSKGDVGPLRIVLWLWKSEQEQKRLYPDFRIKSKRAIQMGEVFKTTLQQLGDSRMALIGFSLGAQVIASALDSMEAEGYTCYGPTENACYGRNTAIPCRSTSSDKYRIALIAPALDPAYACSVANRKACSTLTARTTTFLNRSDRAVKALRIVLRRECTDRSVTLDSLLKGKRLNLGPVRTVDLTWEAGARHSIVKYSRTPSLCRELSSMLAEVAATNFHPIQPVLTSHFAVE